MKGNRKKIIICVLMAVLLMLTMTLTGCGGNGGGGDYVSEDGMYYSDTNRASEPSSEPSKDAGFYMVNDGYDAESMVEGVDQPYYPSTELPGSVDMSRVKLIYTADVWVETMDFDQTLKDLREMVTGCGGYFESSYTENGSYWSDENYKYGSFTIRVPSDKYQEFVNAVSEGLHVTQLSQNTQDIGQAYYEAETHLETLRNKHDRLEELLKQAGSLSDIIELENALSQTEYEIEQYSNELERYDALVDFSTITVNVQTAYQYSPGLGEQRSFFQRVWESIKEGWAGFGENFTDFCEWVGYHLIQIAIVILAIVLFVKFGPHTKDKLKNSKLGKKARKGKKAEDQVEVVRLDEEEKVEEKTEE